LLCRRFGHRREARGAWDELQGVTGSGHDVGQELREYFFEGSCHDQNRNPSP
jgi:hypothetical protein